MKVALLGLGNVGRAVYDIISNKKGLLFSKDTVIVKYILLEMLLIRM